MSLLRFLFRRRPRPPRQLPPDMVPPPPRGTSTLDRVSRLQALAMLMQRP